MSPVPDSPSPPQLKPVPFVASLKPYSPGRPPSAIDLYLDSNEGAAPGPEAATALSEAAQLPLNRYPSTSSLERSIAERWGLEPAGVLVTAGADDALERAIRVVCAPGREAILTTPTFEMLGRYVRLAGADLTEIEWWRDGFPVDAVCEQATDRTVLVAAVSPNNPTGAVLSADDLQALAGRLPSTLILLDGAYIEFADEDLTRVALELPNTLVFRTFSKAWGCAGLRVGYVAGPPTVIGWLRAVGQPYSVAAPSLAAVNGMLGRLSGPPEGPIAATRARRSRLANTLRRLGGDPLPSQANFILVRFADADWVRDALAGLGIAVRRFTSPQLAGWLRITVPASDADLDRLEAALEAALEPEALLFDMDGVLADVSQSYRAAILATARELGAELKPEAIAAAKAAGDANNDWVLTRRLLAERGIERSLDEVTERFETLYQGTDEAPGLRERETLLIDAQQLRNLASRRPLAVVTGRPRADAERFLDRWGIGDLFTAVVSMEDAPLKPDPAPVRLALDRLGVRRAWLIGDTPDDLRAARAAGVVPVGVAPPGDDPATAARALESAGAARVAASTEALLELLDRPEVRS